MNSKEAETKAKDYIKQRHPKLDQLFFSNMYKEGDVWVVRGEVAFKRAFFFTAHNLCEVKVNMTTGTVESCKEAPMRNFK